MKYEVLKEFTKEGHEVYSEELPTKEVRVETDDDVYIGITEHQLGEPLSEPHICIAKGFTSVSMNMSEFLKRIGIKTEA